MDMSKVEHWIREARGVGGLAAEFEALQGVVVALIARYQCIGGVDLLELYDWYVGHLMRLHEVAQNGMNDLSYHMSANPNTKKALVLRIRAILASLPEVSATVSTT